MKRVSCLRMAASAAALFLTACGGGGGVNSFPPPQTPATAFPLKTSPTFETIWAEREYNSNSSGGIGDDPQLNSLQTISYDAVTGSYTVIYTANSNNISATFGPAGRTTSGGIDTYTTSSASATDQLQLYDNVRVGTSDASAPVKLTYLSYGIWSHDDLTTGQSRERYFLFGYPTVAGEMPVSGTASYSTAVSASMKSELASDPGHMLTGSATFMADFGQGTVSTDLTLNYPNAPSYTYSGSGSIVSGNAFSAPFNTSTDPYFDMGSFAGGFYGPQAQEMGYVFVVERGQQDPYAGASIGLPLSWIVGAVVGKKN